MSTHVGYLMTIPVYIYIYIYREREREREIVDFDESDKMIKISGKVDESNTYNGISGDISFF